MLLYASKYHDVHTVVNLSGRYNLEKGIAERLGEDFLEIIKKDGFIDVKNTAGNDFSKEKKEKAGNESKSVFSLCI